MCVAGEGGAKEEDGGGGSARLLLCERRWWLLVVTTGTRGGAGKLAEEICNGGGVTELRSCGRSAVVAEATRSVVARVKKMCAVTVLMVREGCGNGGCCFRRVAVVAGEEMAAAAAMVGGREIKVRVSCVRWRR